MQFYSKMNLFKKLFLLLLICFGGHIYAQKVQQEEPKDIKLISETIDKEGNTIRKLSYKSGNMTVTKTIITPPFPSLKDRRPIDPDTLDKDSLMILVEKSQYLVAIIYKRKRIRQYRAVFGPDRLDDKMQEGDRKTPEGWFKVVAKKDHAAWQKFILLDYPNPTSYERFKERKAKGIIPQNATIGNSVGIHGVFKSGTQMIDLGIGWTDGCIALKPEDIVDLYRFVVPGTKVYVRR